MFLLLLCCVKNYRPGSSNVTLLHGLKTRKEKEEEVTSPHGSLLRTLEENADNANSSSAAVVYHVRGRLQSAMGSMGFNGDTQLLQTSNDLKESDAFSNVVISFFYFAQQLHPYSDLHHEY